MVRNSFENFIYECDYNIPIFIFEIKVHLFN